MLVSINSLISPLLISGHLFLCSSQNPAYHNKSRLIPYSLLFSINLEIFFCVKERRTPLNYKKFIATNRLQFLPLLSLSDPLQSPAISMFFFLSIRPLSYSFVTYFLYIISSFYVLSNIC